MCVNVLVKEKETAREETQRIQGSYPITQSKLSSKASIWELFRSVLRYKSRCPKDEAFYGFFFHAKNFISKGDFNCILSDLNKSKPTTELPEGTIKLNEIWKDLLLGNVRREIHSTIKKYIFQPKEKKKRHGSQSISTDCWWNPELGI